MDSLPPEEPSSPQDIAITFAERIGLLELWPEQYIELRLFGGTSGGGYLWKADEFRTKIGKLLEAASVKGKNVAIGLSPLVVDDPARTNGGKLVGGGRGVFRTNDAKAEGRIGPYSVVWLDLDSPEKGAKNKRKKVEPASVLETVSENEWPEPSIVVSSGVGVHLYWVLDSPCSDLVAVESVMREMAKCMACKPDAWSVDTSCCSAVRVMRLPGSTHVETGRTATIYRDIGSTYPLRQLETVFGVDGKQTEKSNKSTSGDVERRRRKPSPPAVKRAKLRAEDYGPIPRPRGLREKAVLKRFGKILTGDFTVDEIYGPYIEIRRDGKEIQASCPLPDHGGDGDGAKFAINREKKVWTCFSHGGQIEEGKASVGGTPANFLLRIAQEKCSTGGLLDLVKVAIDDLLSIDPEYNSRLESLTPMVGSDIYDPNRPSLSVDGLHASMQPTGPVYRDDTFFQYNGRCYEETRRIDIRRKIKEWLSKAVVMRESPSGDVKICPAPTGSHPTNELEEALREYFRAPDSVQEPFWLPRNENPDTPHDPSMVIPVQNGLLYVHSEDEGPRFTLEQHTDRFFSLSCIPVSIDMDAVVEGRKKAPRHTCWTKFLKDLWSDDPESARALQEYFGLCLTGYTGFHKGMMIVGPKRSGKGTIARVLTRLVGASYATSLTSTSFSSNFGLMDCVGKRVAIMPDLEIADRADAKAIVERLKGIIGEDSVYIDRKYKSVLSTKLSTRFLVLTNQIPQLPDSSDALTSRFVFLAHRKSFLGSEDTRLTEKLCNELEAIFYWSLRGLERLLSRGRFVQPSSAVGDVDMFRLSGSPVRAWVSEYMEIGDNLEVDTSWAYNSWCRWCEKNGIYKSSKDRLSRELKSIIPTMQRKRKRVRGMKDRRYIWTGLGFKDGIVSWGRDSADEQALRDIAMRSGETRNTSMTDLFPPLDPGDDNVF